MGIRAERKIKKLEEKESYKSRRKQIRQKYRSTPTSAWTLTFTKKWTKNIVISDILFTIIYILSGIMSGYINLSGEVYSSFTTFIVAYNSGVVVTLMGYMAKALFETKWEEENKIITNSTEDEQDTFVDIK